MFFALFHPNSDVDKHVHGGAEGLDEAVDLDRLLEIQSRILSGADVIVQDLVLSLERPSSVSQEAGALGSNILIGEIVSLQYICTYIGSKLKIDLWDQCNYFKRFGQKCWRKIVDFD
jgi:hypothetical protein